MWQIIFLIIIFLLIIPIPIKIKMLFNILNLSGGMELKILKIFSFKMRLRFRGAYVYITTKGKTKREKLTAKNFNIMFVIQLFRQIYFRLILTSLRFSSEVGYYNDAMFTALGGSLVDIIAKCVYAKILHNKKSAHIFMANEAKYNQDCLRIKIEAEIKMSIFDVLYSLINSLWSVKGEKYETRSSKNEQN